MGGVRGLRDPVGVAPEEPCSGPGGGVRPVCLPHVGLNISRRAHSWITSLSASADAGEAVRASVAQQRSARSRRTNPWGGFLTGALSLTEVQVSIVDSAECNRSAPYSGRISRDMLCTRGADAASCDVRKYLSTCI